MPKFSVVMPTRNQRRFIPFAVDGILGQTIEDFELIIVNNGSDDGTAEYLDGLTDPRITVVHQENRGAYGGVNRGARMATGEFFTWVSSDNICLPYYLEALHAPFAKDPSFGFSYSAYYTIDDDNRPLGVNASNRLRYRNLIFNRNIGCPSYMYRNRVHQELGFYDEQYRYSCDTEMLSRIFAVHRTAYILEPTQHYRVHAATETANAEKTGGFIDESNKMVQKYWSTRMNNNIINIIDDIYPKRPKNNLNSYFYFYWALAADFYYYMAQGPASSLALQCIRTAPPAFLLDALWLYASCHAAPQEPGALAQARAALAGNDGVDQSKAAALIEGMLALARPYDPKALVLSLPQTDFAIPYERDESTVFSFFQLRRPLPLIT